MIIEQLQRIIKKVQELKADNISCQFLYNSGTQDVQILVFNHPWKAWGKPDHIIKENLKNDAETTLKKISAELTNLSMTGL
jgi:hypothetical protein